MPFAKSKIKVNVPHSSGFDKSHRYTGTGLCGTLIPVLCDEVIPGARVKLRIPVSAQLPPLASDTYMNVKLKYEAFFVPMRLLCKSFESFFNDYPERVQINPNSAAPNFVDVKGLLPVFQLVAPGGESQSTPLSPGTLLDYLGFSSPLAPGDSAGVLINPLPLVAYHLVWQDWYRNPRVQNPAFAKDLGYLNPNISAKRHVSSIPFSFFHDSVSGLDENYIFPASGTANLSYLLADGVSIFSLRQRNFGLDYFTGARVSAQQGDAVSVSIDAPGDDISNANFTISALRAANSLQQFRERNNLSSPRFVDQIKSRYGVDLSDGVAQRPLCIGSATYDISTRGVDQQGEVSGSTQNPFNSVAAQYGRGAALGNDFLIEDFTVNEPGYIMVMQSLVPEVTYSIGADPMFNRYKGPGTIVEMANPLLQNVGDQPIFRRELLPVGSSEDSSAIFGYTDRFADFMFKRNQAHGLMRKGESLQSFVLQRDFSDTSDARLSSAFLEIPTNYLDQVFAVSSQVSGLSYWFDLYFDYRVTMPLAEYSIPSLQDPAYEHGRSVSLRRNGQIF